MKDSGFGKVLVRDSGYSMPRTVQKDFMLRQVSTKSCQLAYADLYEKTVPALVRAPRREAFYWRSLSKWTLLAANDNC